MEKKKILLVGCNGRLGQLACKTIAESTDFEVVGGYDTEYKDGLYDFPIYTSIEELVGWSFPTDFDVIIDTCIVSVIMQYAKEHRIPIVFASHGYSANQQEDIRNLSFAIPVFAMYFDINDILKAVRYLFWIPALPSLNNIHSPEYDSFESYK